MIENIDIVPATHSTLQETLSLLHTIFPRITPIEDPDLWFTISLDPQKNAEKIEEKGVKNIHYYVVLDTKMKKVIGTTGLYQLIIDSPGTIWLGWYCVDPLYRRKGIGRHVLQWTIDKAKQEGKKLLRLYTSPEEDKAAQLVYDKFGFKTTSIEEKDGEIITYKNLDLD